MCAPLNLEAFLFVGPGTSSEDLSVEISPSIVSTWVINNCCRGDGWNLPPVRVLSGFHYFLSVRVLEKVREPGDCAEVLVNELVPCIAMCVHP